MEEKRGGSGENMIFVGKVKNCVGGVYHLLFDIQRYRISTHCLCYCAAFVPRPWPNSMPTSRFAQDATGCLQPFSASGMVPLCNSVHFQQFFVSWPMHPRLKTIAYQKHVLLPCKTLSQCSWQIHKHKVLQCSCTAASCAYDCALQDQCPSRSVQGNDEALFSW